VSFAPEQLPVLCRRCGGAARLLDAQHLQCPYCGQHDVLPGDVVLRNIDLRARIDAARASLAQLDGFGMAMARMYEGRGGALRVVGPLFAFSALVLAQGVVGAATAASSAPESLQACIVLQAGASTALVWTLPLGISLGVLVARARYRRRVRPWLLARAPLAEGAPARCRVCGGDMPITARELFVACPYCKTQNLLVGEVFADRARRLADEQASHHARVMGASMAASTVGAGLDRAMYASAALGWVASLALSAVVQRFVCGWR
jgi:Zn finger protein HypA/HybF involved in hydrogenase expression